MEHSFTVGKAEDGLKLGPFLRRRGVSATLLRRLKYEENGLVVEVERSRTNRVLHAGQAVFIGLPDEEDAPAPPEEIPLHVLYESPHAMVLEKPAGLVMHPTRSHKSGTLANAFAFLMQSRGRRVAFRPVGRLDGDTSGLVLCAMNGFATPLLAGSMQKEYLALAGGCVAGDGAVDAPLAPAPDSVIRQCVHSSGRPARTLYRVLAQTPEWSLLSLRLETGRTHQIRVHMAHVGHPLLGDGLYGGSREQMDRHALHCAALSFCEPGGLTKSFSSPLPPDMRAVLAAGQPQWTEAGKKWLACQTFDTNV